MTASVDGNKGVKVGFRQGLHVVVIIVVIFNGVCLVLLVDGGAGTWGVLAASTAQGIGLRKSIGDGSQSDTVRWHGKPKETSR